MSLTQSCGLCKENTRLCRSHLLPKALYRTLRLEHQSNPNPLMILEAGTRSRAAITSRQASQHLLCQRCENLLSPHEKYVLSLALTRDGKFPLLELLGRAQPITNNPAFSVFHLSGLAEIAIGKLQHFAAGVFWKASAMRWDIPPGGSLHNPLGTRNHEDFGEFLLGRRQFPTQARLMISVCGETDPMHDIVFPTFRRGHGYHAHAFFVPGIGFHLLLGRMLPRAEVAQLWGTNSAEFSVVVHRKRDDGAHQDVFRAITDHTKKLVKKVALP